MDMNPLIRPLPQKKKKINYKFREQEKTSASPFSTEVPKHMRRNQDWMIDRQELDGENEEVALC